MNFERNQRSKRRVVWCSEHEFTRKKLFCDHCTAQIWSAYRRYVLSVDDARRNTFEVYRECHQCM